MCKRIKQRAGASNTAKVVVAIATEELKLGAVDVVSARILSYISVLNNGDSKES